MGVSLPGCGKKRPGLQATAGEPVETCRDTPDKHGMEVRIKE